MFSYQIFLVLFPEFCLINLFFIGLIYASYNLHFISSRKSFNYNFNLLNFVLFCSILFFIFLSLYETPFISQSFVLLNNYLNFGTSTTFLELFVLFFIVLVVLNFSTLFKEVSTKSLEFYLLLFILFSAFVTLTKVNNLFLMLMLLEVSLFTLYALLIYLDHLKVTTVFEGFTKFFLTGSLSSILLLLSILCIYKGVGTCYLQDIYTLFDNTLIKNNFANTVSLISTSFNFSNSLLNILLIGIICFIGGMFFKFAIFPFHSWSPDIYQVMPISLVILISTFPKLIYGILIFKLIVVSLSVLSFASNWIIAVIGFFGFLYTVFLVVEVDNMKRFLAYSSIPHLLTFFLVIMLNNFFSIVYSFVYLVIYLFSLHSTLIILSFNKYVPQQFSNLKKLFLHNPVMSWLFFILLLQLAGLPPFSLFILKLNVLNFLLNSGNLIIYGVMLISSFYSIYYYMRVSKIMFFDKISFFSINTNAKTFENNFTFTQSVVFFVLFFLQLVFVWYPSSIISPFFFLLTFLDI